MYTKDSGKKVKLTDLGFTLTIKERFMKDIGLETSKVDKALNDGLMGVVTKESFRKEEKKASGFTIGQMAVITQALGKKISYQELGSMSGRLDAAIRESGSTARCTVKVNIFGRMAADTREDISTTRSMGMESILGLTEGSLKVNGFMGGARAKEN